ncbi:MAG: hypothetical protein N3D20_02175, partial [Candidatus Pacearchaeota archaeon]|nr:hypothetical protein [Candidatus Pacearchaeota archaeon]
SIDYKQMPYYFGERSAFAYNHTMPFMAPSLSSLGIVGFDEQIMLDLIVKCVNVNGYENKADFVISMCLKAGEDVAEPIILGYEPINGFVLANTINSNVTIYLNEPSECKWDRIDKNYDEMNNTFDCLYEDERMYAGVIAYGCYGVLPIEENTTLYVRCKDQPWLKGINESFRNAMTRSYSFNLKKTLMLKIDNIKPHNEEIVLGFEPATIELSLETKGGIDNSAKCSYKVGEKYVEFSTTFGSKHSQIFNSLWKNDIFGDEEKTIEIKCEDSIGNVAEGIARFKVKIDNEEPKITRVYDKEDMLYVITNEKAECVYNRDGCEGDYGKWILMEGKEFVHKADFTVKKPIYLRCTDYFGNVQEDCLVVTKG